MRNASATLCFVLFAALAAPAAAATALRHAPAGLAPQQVQSPPAPVQKKQEPAQKKQEPVKKKQEPTKKKQVRASGGSQPDKPAPPAATVPPVAAPARPSTVRPPAAKPFGGSQGDGIVQDPRTPEPARPRLPPFDKRKGIQA